MNRQLNVISVLLITITLLVVLLVVSLKNHHDYTLSAIQDQPSVVQPPPKQPVYLMVRCPKGGGDVVFNITDDIALRQVYPN